ncbi:MAG: FixH family protein [Rectinemataceae bacterium]
MKALPFIIAFIVVAMTVATIVIGTNTFEGTVVDKPYEAGLAWEADQANRQALGWSVALSGGPFKVGEDELWIEALGRDGKPLSAAEVSVKVSRPSTSAHDRSYKAELQGDGRYLSRVSLPLQGNWDIVTTVSTKSGSSSYTQTLRAEAEKSP